MVACVCGVVHIGYDCVYLVCLVYKVFKFCICVLYGKCMCGMYISVCVVCVYVCCGVCIWFVVCMQHMISTCSVCECHVCNVYMHVRARMCFIF